MSPFRRASKFFDLMPWLELGDATSLLSDLARETVTSDKLLRLAMEGHLTLSVRLVSGTPVLRGKAVPRDQVEVKQIPTLEGDGYFLFIDGTVLPDREHVVVYEDRIDTIHGVWDIPMLGGDLLSVEAMYEAAVLRDAPEMFNLEGTFLTDSNGTYCKLMERFEKAYEPKEPYHQRNFYPAAGLPDDAVLVMRTAEIRRFAAQFTEAAAAVEVSAPTPEKPLETRERNTLLTIIAALASLARVDTSKPSAAAATIESETERLGARVAARTIENHLKKIGDALEARSG